MKLQVVLGIVTPDAAGSRVIQSLVLQGQRLVSLPTREWQADTKTSLHTVADLLLDLTGLHAVVAGSGFVEVKHVGLADALTRIDESGEQVISAVYGCMVPEPVQPKDPRAKWLPFIDLLSKTQMTMDHQELLKIIALRI